MVADGDCWEGQTLGVEDVEVDAARVGVQVLELGDDEEGEETSRHQHDDQPEDSEARRQLSCLSYTYIVDNNLLTVRC